MKSVLKISAVALAVVVLSSSCAKTFYSVDGKSLAQKHHRSVAVMPSFVSIAPKGVYRKAVTEALERQEAVEALNFQQAIHAWMQKSKSEGKVGVEIQDIETTNAKLKSAGYPETLLTDAKLCEILGVDGIIVSNFDLYQPMTAQEALTLNIVTRTWAFYSDEVRGTIAISDCANKKIIWSYQHKMEGDSPVKVVENFMKKAGKKMPYVK
jgi:hypothetical protein